MQNELLAGLGQINPVLWYCSDRGEKGKAIELNGEPDIEGARNNKQGIYFCVNELGEKRNESGNLRNNANVTRPLACFADFDTGTFEEQLERIVHSPLEPSALVKSGRGYHAYWFLDGTQTKGDLERWSDVQRGIATFFGSDDAVKDYSRIMRLPGSWHCKGEEPVLVTLEKCDPTLRYSLEEIALEFPAPAKAGAMGEIEKLLTGITGKGGRNTGATKVVGILLRHLPMPQWEPIGWPMLQAWNRKQCIPPDDERTLRGTFDSISRSEATRRQSEGRGVPTYTEDELEPEVVVNGDTVSIRERVDDGVAEFEFSELEQSKNRELDSTLVVRLHIPGSHAKPFSGRLNVMSMSAREGFSRTLAKSFGKNLPWDLLLSRAAETLRQHWAARDTSLWIEDAEDEETRMLFHPFLDKGGANVFFGKGGSGKTFISLRIALSYALGIPFLDFTPAETGVVLFVDYEATRGEIKNRLRRIAKGDHLAIPMDSLEKRFRYINLEGALPDCIPTLKKIVAEHNVGLLVIDSAVQACGGEPEKADVASRYFNALRSLGVPSLTIAHETKLENHAYPFGSVFFWNAPRNIWNVQCDSDEDDRVKQVGLFHRKNNNGPIHRAMAVRLFHGEDQTEIGWGDRGLWEQELGAGERVVRRLRERSMTKGDLYAALNKVSRNTIDVAMRRLRARGEIVCLDEKNGIWAIPPVQNGGTEK